MHSLKQHQHRIFGLIAATLLLWAAQPTSAAPIAFEGFESYTAGSNLNGGSGGSGWTGNWTAVAGVTTQTQHLQVGANDGQLQAGRILAVTNDSAMRRAFPATTGDVYLSFLLRLESFEDDDFVQFQLSDGATGDNAATLSVGVRNSAGNPFFARVGGNANTTNSAVLAADNTDYFLVARFSMDGAASYNRVDLFLDPTSNVEGDQIPIATRINPATGLTQLDLFNVRTASLEAGDTVFVDNILIGTSFADVVPVPEPSSLVALCLGAGALVLYRRRQTRA
jgi:hypothetical protein